MIKNQLSFWFILLFTLFLGVYGYTQTIVTQSLNSSGVNMSQSNGSLSFTIGELVIVSQMDNQGNILNNGFIAGAALSSLTIQEPNTDDLDFIIFPNPTTEVISIRINDDTIEKVIVTIKDSQGKEMYSERLTFISNTIRINTQSYASGAYLLYILNSKNKILGIYKILKN